MEGDAAEREKHVRQRLSDLKKPGSTPQDVAQFYDEWKNHYDEVSTRI